MQQKPQTHNHLDVFRRKMRFNRKHVARLLGHRDTSAIADYETGERLPSLINAFRLGIILRVPLEFLFPSLYDGLRETIRAEEAQIAADLKPSQQTLF